MSEIKVTAIDGLEYNKSDCRKIKSDYYKIGDPAIIDSGHCYYINGKYYKYNTGYIVYDHRIKQYIIKNSMVIVDKGVIGIDNKDNLVFGSFSKDPNFPYDVYLNYKGIKYLCLNEDILKNSFRFRESLVNGEYYDRRYIPSIDFIKPRKCSNHYKQSLSYDSKNLIRNGVEIYNKLYEPKPNKIVDKYGDFTKDYSFGFEFETTLGSIPDRVSKRLGLIPLRDGSVAGLEYVTIPLQGKKGISTLIESVEELSKRTTYDENCSLHLHVGNLPRTESFFLALFRVIMSIEDELFAMFPIYKKYNFDVKRKHYTKKFPIDKTIMLMDGSITKENLSKNFNILFEFLSMGVKYSNYGSDIDQVDSHPSDPNGNSKWNIKSRYYHINFIPLLFGNKQTIEFRIHTPTFDIDKIMNYLAICTSIIDYTIKFEGQILKDPTSLFALNLKSIVYENYKNFSSSDNRIGKLYQYMSERKDYIYKCNCKGDIIAKEDNFTRMSHYYSWNPNETISPFTGNKYLSFVDPLPPPIFARRGRNVAREFDQDLVNVAIRDVNNLIIDENLDAVRDRLGVIEYPPEIPVPPIVVEEDDRPF